ncbi:MAG TPA: CBS domain-containing protein [Anaerolineae bacterium]|mgnify:CR=1 FL=1|nr:CBS domain-containing protein [Anaerolineae bacterium]
MHVLLADDQAQVRSALRLLLEQEPNVDTISEVADTETLLAFVKEHHPDLLLLDWELAGLADAEVVAELRRASPNLAIVALSGRLGARQTSLEAGVEAFVSKGRPPEELLSILHKIKRNRESVHRERVEDWMTREVVQIAPDATLMETYRLMSEKNTRRLPVVNKGQLVGIICLNDILKASTSDRGTVMSDVAVAMALASLTVGQVMTANPVTISNQQTIGEAASLMINHQISSLPVVDSSGSVVGVITESDIFKTMVRLWNVRVNLATQVAQED